MGTSVNICMFLSNAFDPDPRVYMVAKTLVNHGFSVDLFCWDRDGHYTNYENIDGISVFRIFVPSLHGRGSGQIFYLPRFWLKSIKKILKQNRKYDLFYSHDFDTLPLGYVLSRIFRKKLVYDSHESYVDMLINVHPYLRKIIFHTENFLLNRTDLVVTVGERLKDYLESRGAKRVIVVGNWKNLSEYSFGEDQISEARKELGLNKYKLIISFISHLNPERQLENLLKATIEHPDICLLIGGKGPLEDVVRYYAKNFDNIYYLGFVKPKLVPVYTAISDVIFYGFDPSNRNARFSAPNKLFEALAAGKALISGDFGEIAQIIRLNNCGIIIDDYSVEEISGALSFLKTHPRELKKFQRNAYRAALHKYNWKKAQEILLENIRFLI